MSKTAAGTVQLQTSSMHQQQLGHRRTVRRALQRRESREVLLLRMLRVVSTLQQMTTRSTSGAAGCGGSTSESTTLSIPFSNTSTGHTKMQFPHTHDTQQDRKNIIYALASMPGTSSPGLIDCLAVQSHCGRSAGADIDIDKPVPG